MKSGNYQLKKIKKLNSDIRNMKSVTDLASYLPIFKLKSIASCILFLWILSPVYILLKGCWLGVYLGGTSFINALELVIDWSVLLQQLGYLGCIILALLLLKSYQQFLVNEFSLRQYFEDHIIEISLTSLFIWAILSTLFSDDVGLSLNGTFYRNDGLASYTAYVGIFTCGYLMNSEMRVKRILKIFVFSSTVISLLMLINVDYINRLLNFYSNSAVFYNINHFGYYLCMAIMSASSLFLIDNSQNNIKYMYLICFIVLVSALVKNSSFGPYIAVVLGMIFIGIISAFYSRISTKNVIVIILTFLITSFIMNLFNSFIKIEFFKLFGDVYNITNDIDVSEKAGSGRWELWKNGIQFSLEKPLLGYGPENLGKRYLLVGINQDRPHNEFIQIAASLGIPALLFYIIAIYVHFLYILRKRKTLNITIISINSIVFVYLVSSFFGNTMFYTSPFYFMILGLAISNTKLL